MRWSATIAVLALVIACGGDTRDLTVPPIQRRSPPVVFHAPRFEDFPVDTFVAFPARVVLGSDPSARHFRTVLLAGAAKGPNFAGHFTIVTWGCGTQCLSYAILNARTGRVYGDTSLDFSCHEPEFRRNSALVVQQPATGTGSSCSGARTQYFQWTGESFAEIRAPAI